MPKPAMKFHMYVWINQPDFVAIAQARTVAEARQKMLEEMGESGDGSCPERDEARRLILRETPSIWHGANAEFVLTDSAELREEENQTRIFRQALVNCRLLASRELYHYRVMGAKREMEAWANILKFCSDAGVKGSVLRDGEPHSEGSELDHSSRKASTS